MTPVQECDDSDTAQIEPVRGPDTEKLLRQATNLLSERRIEPAIQLCQQAIRENSEATDAYVLLGMAQEEQGNLHLAIEAYQQAVAIEPERTSEQQRIARLEERIAEEASMAEPDQQRLQRLARLAAVMLGVAVAFLVIVGTVALIVRARQARQMAAQQYAYQAAMQQGQNLVAEGHYDQSIEAFRNAWQIRPGDAKARKWWQRAYTLACQRAEYEGYVQRSGAGKMSLKSAANPFAPVPIGPGAAEPKTGSAAGGRSVPVPYIPAPEWEEWPIPTASVDEGAGPLQAPEELSTSGADSEVGVAPPGTGEVTSQQPRGEVTIWVSEPPEQRGGSPTGDELRAAGDQLRYENHYSEAIEKYRRAKEQYQRESQQDPITAPAKQSAIESCDQAIKILQEQSGE